MPVENGMWQSVTMQFPRFLFLATNPNSIVEAKGKKYKRKTAKKRPVWKTGTARATTTAAHIWHRVQLNRLSNWKR